MTFEDHRAHPLIQRYRKGRHGCGQASLRVCAAWRIWLPALMLATTLFAGEAFSQAVEQAFDLAQGSTEAPLAPANSVKTFAFAKASPLPVSDSPALTDSRPQEFEFGKAYEVMGDASGYSKLNLGSKFVYVRSTLVVPTSSPRWLTTTSAYNRSERARVQFWESGARLNDFLSNADRIGSPYDYEEFFDNAPTFQIKLPIVEKDSADLLNRQIKMVSVLLPISRGMSQAFEAAKSRSERPIDLDLVVDVSGSTNGFLEGVIAGMAKALRRNEELRKKIRSVVVATFGATKTNRSAFVGKVSLGEIEKVAWHPPGVDQTTDGDREPLVDGLVTLSKGLNTDDTATQVVLVLSGADVELATTAPGASLSIGRFGLPLHSHLSAIMAQITPEPGDNLRNASKQLGGIPHVRYVDYSESMANDIVLELVRIGESQKNSSVSLQNFGPVLAAANDKRMMAFLPRALSPASSLPPRAPYAAQADWYTTRLWLPVDNLIWEEKTQ